LVIWISPEVQGGTVVEEGTSIVKIIIGEGSSREEVEEDWEVGLGMMRFLGGSSSNRAGGCMVRWGMGVMVAVLEEESTTVTSHRIHLPT
jgi:hypothetical protein